MAEFARPRVVGFNHVALQKEVADQPISIPVECEILPLHCCAPEIAAGKSVCWSAGSFRPPFAAVTCRVAHLQSLPRKLRNGVDVAKSRGCGRLQLARLAPKLRRRLLRRAARPIQGTTNCH
jgi:hypothetical protein